MMANISPKKHIKNRVGVEKICSVTMKRDQKSDVFTQHLPGKLRRGKQIQ